MFLLFYLQLNINNKIRLELPDLIVYIPSVTFRTSVLFVDKVILSQTIFNILSFCPESGLTVIKDFFHIILNYINQYN